MSAHEDALLAQVMVQRTPNGVLVTDAQGRVRLCNPALSRMVPVVPDPVGRRPIEAVPVDAIAAALDADDEVEQTLRLGHKDLLLRVVPLGPGRGRLAIVQDVTRLRAAERYRQEFVANVSHELRTPATAIAGYAETLLHDRDRLSPDVARMVEVIPRNGRRLTELFDDLLHLARLDAAQSPLELEPLPLAPLVHEAADKLGALADERRVTVRLQLPADLQAVANRDALGHVISNLLSNAIKYSHAGGEVEVRGRPRPEGVILEFVDQGVGIDPVHHDRIFERFYRVDRGRARDAGGTGLGLAIVKHLCKKMGARVELTSRPTRGSTFRLVLQEAPEAEE